MDTAIEPYSDAEAAETVPERVIDVPVPAQRPAQPLAQPDRAEQIAAVVGSGIALLSGVMRLALRVIESRTSTRAARSLIPGLPRLPFVRGRGRRHRRGHGHGL